MPRNCLLVILMALTSCAGSPAPSSQSRPPTDPADLVLRGGVILTMDGEQPRATALAVRGERLIAVGSDAEIDVHVGAETRVVELAGRGVSPGLVDGHAHLYGLGIALESVSLRGITSEAEAASVVGAAAKSRAPDEWVTGRGWDQNRWSPPSYPTRASLDAAVAVQPVVLRRIDGHALWANSAAMARAGVTRATSAPAGGRIIKDDAGEPTGVFIDNAMDIIERNIPAPTPELRRRRILAAARAAVAVGLTGVHDMGIDDRTAAVYRALAAAGELPLRVNGFVAADSSTITELVERERELDPGDGYFALRGIKFFADGALGSRGAALLAPYSDELGNQGNWVSSPAEIAAAAMAAAASGWQIGIHSIGDGANRAVLDAYSQAIERYPERDLRFRVEHAQVLAPAEIARFGQLGVLAAMQPTHATSDMPWAEARLGSERIAGAYAWRAILAAGGRIVGGSDFPVEEVAPLLGVYAAVTRQDRAQQPPGGWYPAQCMTLEEALRAFTVEPAFAAFVEGHRGRLREGYVADVTVYDQPLVGDASLLQVNVDMTIVGGHVVFER